MDNKSRLQVDKKEIKPTVMTITHIPPFILNPLSHVYTRGNKLLDLYSKKTIYFIFCRENQIFRRLFRVSGRSKTCILNSNTLIRQVYPFGVESPVVGGGTLQEFFLPYLATKEPFFLTADKAARLALIEPHGGKSIIR